MCLNFKIQTEEIEKFIGYRLKKFTESFQASIIQEGFIEEERRILRRSETTKEETRKDWL